MVTCPSSLPYHVLLPITAVTIVEAVITIVPIVLSHNDASTHCMATAALVPIVDFIILMARGSNLQPRRSCPNVLQLVTFATTAWIRHGLTSKSTVHTHKQRRHPRHSAPSISIMAPLFQCDDHCSKTTRSHGCNTASALTMLSCSFDACFLTFT
eukprot:m.66066 g.66066  ORF g.66066 m.66066 type:complete len:155 (-) comp14036_c1_seq1:67-531(-)